MVLILPVNAADPAHALELYYPGTKSMSKVVFDILKDFIVNMN